MKRFFSLMLVALLLVSALPVAAFATETVTCPDHPTAKVAYRGVAADDKEATCEKGETKSYLCFAGDELTSAAHNFDVEVSAADGHKWDAGTITTEPTCTTAGVKTYTCETDNTHTKTEPVAMLDHVYENPVVTTASTCAAEGVQTSTCACGAKKTTAIAKLAHEYVNGVCTACGDRQGMALTFRYMNENGSWTSSMATIRSGDAVSMPEIPSVSGMRHTGWKVRENGVYRSIEDGDVWNKDSMEQEITATYVESPDDGLVDLTVYAHFYVDGVYHHKEKLYTKSFNESKNNNMHNWLYSDAGMNKTRTELAELSNSDGYQWEPEKYYDYFDSREATESDLVADGDKSVFIKVGSTNAIEATVLLHVHTSKTRTIDRTINMDGYTADDYISKPEALSAIKKYYNGTNISIGDLYEDTEWENLLDGKNSEGGYSVKIEDNGTTEIHVILKNAVPKNPNADPSNPKTGDYIMIAVGTMVLAAAAVVTLAELKKRKMI